MVTIMRFWKMFRLPMVFKNQKVPISTFLFQCNKFLDPVKNIRIPNHAGKFIRLSNISVGFSNLALMTIYCDKLADVKEVNNEKMTHEDCIKQACMISANSATTLLTTATTVILDICSKYKKSLSSILRTYEELLLTKGEIPEIWEMVVESRVEVQKMKAALSEMNNYMSSVEKVVNSTTEAAFLAGAEYLCTVLCERLYSAQQEITRTLTEIKKLEEDFLKIEEEVAKSVKSNK